MSIDKITLIFAPVDNEEYPKSIKFYYKIRKGDYKTFADLILDFGGRNLSNREIYRIIKVYPELETKIKSDKKRNRRIEDIFGQSCIIDGLIELKDKVYEISYST